MLEDGFLERRSGCLCLWCSTPPIRHCASSLVAGAERGTCGVGSRPPAGRGCPPATPGRCADRRRPLTHQSHEASGRKGRQDKHSMRVARQRNQRSLVGVLIRYQRRVGPGRNPPARCWVPSSSRMWSLIAPVLALQGCPLPPHPCQTLRQVQPHARFGHAAARVVI